MRPDNIRPRIQFEGDRMHLKFKYPPTQEEFDAALANVIEAMKFANKMSGQDIHIIGWSNKEKDA